MTAVLKPKKVRRRPELEKAIADYRKKTKRDDIIVRGEDLKGRVWKRTSTGSLSFDIALGGGWPLNVWNEVIGHSSNGKTTLTMKTIAAAQEKDPDHQCLWIAAEAFVPAWAEAAGMDLDRVILVETSVMEEAFQAVIDFMDARAVDSFVIDSLPALSPDTEVDRGVDDLSPGLGAKLTNKFFRKARAAGRRNLLDETDRPWLGIVINQWREQIGVSHGDPRTTPGGKGKDYEFFTRVEVRRGDWLKSNIEGQTTKTVGIEMKLRSIKNKSAPGNRSAIVDFYYDNMNGFTAGEFDVTKELFNIAVSYGIIERKGATYLYEGERFAKSKAEALIVLRSTLDMNEAVEQACRDIAASVAEMPSTVAPDDPDEDDDEA